MAAGVCTAVSLCKPKAWRQRWPCCLCLHQQQGVALVVHCAWGMRAAGRALGGCSLKSRNKPAQRQRGQHKDVFPGIAWHNTGHEMRAACSRGTHTQILIWSRKQCFVLYRLFWFLRGGTACECDELSSPCMGGNGIWHGVRSRFLPACHTLI
jgi:hypothetical protein